MHQVTCLYCGIIFEGVKSRKFCSHSCSAKYGNPGPRGPYCKNRKMLGSTQTYQELYDEVRRLRIEEGWGYNIIAKKTGVYFRTVSRWTKDIPAPYAHRRSSDLQIKSLDECRSKSAIREKLIQMRGYKCECCGLTEWLERPIYLEVHHIDGDRKNSTAENLVLLCLNCHATTPNFRSGNIKSKL